MMATSVAEGLVNPEAILVGLTAPTDIHCTMLARPELAGAVALAFPHDCDGEGSASVPEKGMAWIGVVEQLASSEYT